MPQHQPTLNKVATDGLMPTIDAVRSKLDQPLPLGYCNAGFVLESDVLTWVDNRKDYSEPRKISIGLLDEEIVIVVVHTDRNGITRIISARPAKQKERRLYNEHIKKTS